MEFFTEHNYLILTNPWFRNHETRLYSNAWWNTGDVIRCQIEFGNDRWLQKLWGYYAMQEHSIIAWRRLLCYVMRLYAWSVHVNALLTIYWYQKSIWTVRIHFIVLVWSVALHSSETLIITPMSPQRRGFWDCGKRAEFLT